MIFLLQCFEKDKFFHFSKSEHLSKGQNWGIWEVGWLSPSGGLLQWNQKLSSRERAEESPGKSVKGKQFSDQAGCDFSGKIHPQRCSNEGNTNVMFCLVFLYICCRLLMEYEEHLFKFHLKIKKSTSFYFSYISSFFLSFYIFVAGCWWSMKNIWGTLWRRWI